MGGYAGSDQFVITALSRVNCKEITKAWLILEPTNPQQISPNVLTTFGINMQRDYVKVAEMSAPTTEASNKKSTLRKQLLLKPNSKNLGYCYKDTKF